MSNDRAQQPSPDVSRPSEESALSVADAKLAYAEFRDRRKILPGDALTFEEWMEFAVSFAAVQQRR